MSDVFDGLVEGLHQALDHARGKTVAGERVHRVGPSFVAEARERAGLTQAEMAKVLGASLGTVRKWETGERTPSGAAGTLVKILHAEPQLVLQAAGWNSARKVASNAASARQVKARSR